MKAFMIIASLIFFCACNDSGSSQSTAINPNHSSPTSDDEVDEPSPFLPTPSPTPEIVAPTPEPIIEPTPEPSPSPTPPPVVVAPFHSSPAVGSFNRAAPNWSNDVIFNEDGEFQIKSCHATYEIVGSVQDPNFQSWQNIRVQVKSFTVVAQNCLIPNQGDYDCIMRVTMPDPQSTDSLFRTKVVTQLSCGSFNFTWFRSPSF